MKPIIVDLKDISDSTEVYDSKPNRFVPYTIYIICAILAIALIWMYLFRMDIVVKADSVFRGDDDSTAVSCAVGRDKEFDDSLGVDDSRECFVGCCCLLERDFMAVNAGLPIGGNVSVFPQLVV